MNATKPCIIYALSDPRSPSDIRYIGKTHGRLRQRLNLHVHCSKIEQSHKGCWIRKVLREGFRPRMWPLEVVAMSDWEQRERYWINFFKPLGRLTNASEGGEGAVGFRHTKESRARLGASLRAFHLKHPEARLQAAERMRKFKMPEYAKAILRSKALGRLHSEATKRRLSEIRKGKPRTPAQMKSSMTPRKHWKPVVCVETGVVYTAIGTAKRATGIKSIKQAIDHPNWKAGGYHWRFATKEDLCPVQ